MACVSPEVPWIAVHIVTAGSAALVSIWTVSVGPKVAGGDPVLIEGGIKIFENNFIGGPALSISMDRGCRAKGNEKNVWVKAQRHEILRCSVIAFTLCIIELGCNTGAENETNKARLRRCRFFRCANIRVWQAVV
jgi:hypothetical protein